MDLAKDLAALDGQRWLTVGRELTKQFEDVVRLRAADWPAWLDPEEHNPLLLASMLQPCANDLLRCNDA